MKSKARLGSEIRLRVLSIGLEQCHKPVKSCYRNYSADLGVTAKPAEPYMTDIDMAATATSRKNGKPWVREMTRAGAGSKR